MKSLWKAFVAAVLVAGAVYFIVWHWARFRSDFWEPDRSYVGPNLVASIVQWAFILIFVSLLYPPWRRAVHRYVSGHVNAIKSHISSEQKEIHKKLDHVIKHSPDIPAYDEHSATPVPTDASETIMGAPVTPLKPANPPKPVKRAPKPKKAT